MNEKPKLLVVEGNVGGGKCLRPHEEILMANGQLKMAKDIRVGDELVGDDGSVRIVKSTASGRAPMYRVRPQNNQLLADACDQVEQGYVCNDEHILVLRATTTTIQLLDQTSRSKHASASFTVAYPSTTKEGFPERVGDTFQSPVPRFSSQEEAKRASNERARELTTMHGSEWYTVHANACYEVCPVHDGQRDSVEFFTYPLQDVRYYRTRKEALEAALDRKAALERDDGHVTFEMPVSKLFAWQGAKAIDRVKRKVSKLDPVDDGAFTVSTATTSVRLPDYVVGYRVPIDAFPAEYDLHATLSQAYEELGSTRQANERATGEEMAWLLGMLIGGASAGNTTRLSAALADDHLADKLKSIAEKIDLSVDECNAFQHFLSSSVATPLDRADVHGDEKRNNLLWLLADELGLCRGKSVPHQLIASGRTVRLSLLAGIMDSASVYSDDHWEQHRFEVVQEDLGLCKHIALVARTLGFTASIASEKAHQEDATCWKVTMSGDSLHTLPCIAQRNQVAGQGAAPTRKSTRVNQLHYNLVIDRLGEGDYCGFELEESNGRFLLGDCSVTHNTTLCGYLHRQSNGRTAVLTEDVNEKFLQLFYDDPDTYGFSFQMLMREARTNGNLVQLQEIRMQKPNGQPAPSLALLDRSVVGDFVFAVANYVRGSINDKQMEVYTDMAGCSRVQNVSAIFDTAYKGYEWTVLYLHSPFAECKRRAENRGGVESTSNIEQWYYELLEQVYFNVVMHLRKQYPSRVHVSTWEHYSAQNGIYNDAMFIVDRDRQTADDRKAATDDCSQTTVADEMPVQVVAERLERMGIHWYSRAERNRLLTQWAIPFVHCAQRDK